MPLPYYRASGRVPLRAMPIVLLYMLATLPAAWLYAWLVADSPRLIAPFLVVAYAFVLGLLADLAGGHAKVRNPAWMGCLGLLIGFAGWYAQSAAWLALKSGLFEQQPHAGSVGAAFLDLVAHPGALFGALARIADVGPWSIIGHRVAGWTLAPFWLAECGVFLLFPYVLGRSRANEPFNEAAGAWAEKTVLARSFAYIDDADAVRASLEQDPGTLVSVLEPKYPNQGRNHARVTIHRCRGEDSYVSVDNVVSRIDKGKVKESATSVVQFLRMRGTDPDELTRALMEGIPNPPERDDPAGAPVPPELETALAHLHAERYEKVLATASAHVHADELALRTDANRLCATANSRLGRWQAACTCWEALFEDEPSAHNALQMATSSVMAGELARGESWLDRAFAINGASQEMPGIAMETNFISALTQSGNPQAALPYLERLKDVYMALGITDPTFLFLRHVPRFDMFLEQSVKILDAGMDAEQKRDWYASMLPHLDDDGKTMLTAWMDAQPQPG